jgi:formate/nitrite transporter FocA (FNT family)
LKRVNAADLMILRTGSPQVSKNAMGDNLPTPILETEEPSTTEENKSQDQSDESSGGKGTRLTASEIYENVRADAEKELERPTVSLLWSAIAAGLTIGFSFFASSYLSTLVSGPYKGAVAAAGYPLGFIFVVLARSQLFTENTLEPIIPVLHHPSWSILGQLLSLWGIVLLGNLMGCLVFALVAEWTPMIDPELKKVLLERSVNETSGGFLLVGFRAIYAGWLVALMAWLIASTRSTTAQVILVWLTTAPIAALGFRHSIAGSVEAFYSAFAGANWGGVLGKFIAPAVIGNIIGGVLFVALLNHGQVVADTEREKEKEDESS